MATSRHRTTKFRVGNEIAVITTGSRVDFLLFVCFCVCVCAFRCRGHNSGKNIGQKKNRHRSERQWPTCQIPKGYLVGYLLDGSLITPITSVSTRATTQFWLAIDGQSLFIDRHVGFASVWRICKYFRNNNLWPKFRLGAEVMKPANDLRRHLETQ